jgi:hypothetical protein
VRTGILLAVAGAALLPSGLAFGQSQANASATPTLTATLPEAPIATTSLIYDLQDAPPQQSYPKPVPSQTPIPSMPAPVPSTEPLPQATPPMKQAEPHAEYNAYDPKLESNPRDVYSSVYIPVDSWIYPQMVRLYEMGYVDTMFLSMRPWTRRSVLHMLQASQDAIMKGNSEEAKEILAAVSDDLASEHTNDKGVRSSLYGTESVYTRLLGISGPTLNDSYHLGQTISNDYGRPYESGFNNITGFSTIAEVGRFSLYVRGEYQHAPSATGYSQAFSEQLSLIDLIPYSGSNLNQATIPTGPIAAQNPFRLVEATLSYHILGHEISGGKSDAWLGPGAGGALAWSNNAENIYSFRINRIEPLHVPWLSYLIGPIRYDFFYGSLKGHTYPNSPYVHSFMVSFQPTRDLEIGFQRTVIFGGQGHEPVTLHTFLKSFFSVSDTTEAEKFSVNDPGARFSAFDLSYRLPFVRKYATFYVDAISHDDVTPISAPRRAAYRTGIDLSQIPGIPKLEFRVEAVSTDPGVSPANNGQFEYDETIQKQGYTNKGIIMGDWIGREAKGGQAWVTWHLSSREWVQVEYLNKKTPFNFIPQGTTQNQFKATAVKRFHRDLELNTWVQYEGWKAPIYKPGLQKDTTVAVQITWFPKLKTSNLFQ